MKTLISVLILLELAIIVESQEELVSVFVLFQHGARAPLAQFSDNTTKAKFPNGLGELTADGIRGSFELGKYLQNRYITKKKFLRTPLLPSQVYFRSRAINRCLMSALAVGSAMFSTETKPAMNAVSVYSYEKDEELLDHPRQCPYVASRLKQKCRVSPPSFTGPLYDAFVYECLGLKSSYFSDTGSFAKAEALVTEDKNGLHKDNTEFQKNKDELYKMYRKVFAYNVGVGEPKVLRVKQGRLLHTIIKTLRDQRQEYDAHGSIKKRKFTAYSVEDWLMQAFLHAIGADKVLGEKIPDYNSMIIIELKKAPEWSIQVFYKKDRNQGSVDITQSVRRCTSSPCPLEFFLWCCDDYITEDVGKACAEPYNQNQYNH